ncbi:hypothetical protein PsYK624_047830 [Phanerochaete sordida]|uniref:Uncharacterized protein n=1 Tax=Phanerochaete sordida TaxID=48140 RepID=A0A9P3G6G5_9APHY|nr:hypothetical protein PsYK624_047830 [Phanerochaete sordida]
MAAVAELSPYSPSQASSSPNSPNRRERPLPPLPTDDAQREPSSPASPMIPKASAVALGKRKAASFAAVSFSESVRRMLHDPSMLSALLGALQWPSFHALISTCRTFRRTFTRPELRDVIFSHFVPGYSLALGSRQVAELSVDITIEDLALFVMSQEYPLHVYPMHALAIIASPRDMVERPPTDPYTQKLVSMAQVHSRMVLLLQALVHSGFALSSPLDSDDFALWSSPQGAPLLPGVRELTFPKPLAVFDQENSHQKARADVPGPARTNSRRSSTGTLHRRYSTSERPRASNDFSIRSTMSRSRSRLRPVLSVLNGGPKVPLPPPSDNPPALSFYVGSWRRTLVHGKSVSSTSAISDEEDEPLPMPHIHERRSSSMQRSLESSTGSSSPSSSSRSNSHTDYTTDASSISPKESAKPLYSHTSIGRTPSSSPQDISMATSRFRAPIVRVFVPCQQLDEIAITACEEQLMDADLWRHLSAGDIVCNFGFVPPPEPDSASQASTPGSKSDDRAGHRRRWLLFNGYCLVHYIPPSPPPLQNCLTLPSPFYFSHILPPFSDPRFVLALPPLSSSSAGVRSARSRALADGPYAQLTLSHVRARVASPHSPGGHALVRKYIWLARIPYVGPHSRTEARDALGEGWQGEWVLEAEGTKEGRQSLLDAVRPGPDGATPRGLWEVARDRSGGGRVWMRLVVPNIDAHAPELMNSTD